MNWPTSHQKSKSIFKTFLSKIEIIFGLAKYDHSKKNKEQEFDQITTVQKNRIVKNNIGT